jgi:hypothetical protein
MCRVTASKLSMNILTLFLVLSNELLVLNATRIKLISLGHGITKFNKNHGNGTDRQRNNGRGGGRSGGQGARYGGRRGRGRNFNY